MPYTDYYLGRARITLRHGIRQTPVTDRFARARILGGLKMSKRELAKTQAEYYKFKKYKTRTAISK